jgi:hypothetical protein
MVKCILQYYFSGVIQVVKCLPTKHEALSAISSTANQNQTKTNKKQTHAYNPNYLKLRLGGLQFESQANSL